MSFIIFLLVLSVLIFVHESGHFLLARRLGVRVKTFSFGFGKKLFKLKGKETEYCISAIPIGGYIKMAGDETGEKLTGAREEFLSRSVRDRFLIIFAGPALNYLMALLLFWMIFAVGNPTMTAKVGDVLDGFPAKESGIQKNDVIVAIDGKPLNSWDEVTEIVHKKLSGEVKVTLKRQDRTRDFIIRPRVREVKNLLGQKVKIAQIGIAPAGEIIMVKYPLPQAIALGTKKLLTFTQMTYKALWRIVTGGLPLKESLSGPVGIFFITKEAAKAGFIYLLQIVALLSASLAIFNLLPIPVLDGGHIIFLGLEKIRKKPLNPRVQEAITNVAVYFLIFLGAIVIYNDLSRFGILGKIVTIFK
ncbi:MAG: RIP metalloprotease RseP [Candidatus Omnitrophota bacterium]